MYKLSILLLIVTLAETQKDPVKKIEVDGPVTSSRSDAKGLKRKMEVCRKTDYKQKNKLGPLVPCNMLPTEFIECSDPIVMPMHQVVNESVKLDGFCSKMGGERAEDVEWTAVQCQPLECIECSGSRVFRRKVPCIKYTGHYFLSSVLYSMFLGFVAVDRFCLGYSAIAVGKLMTLGGLGVWWVVDVFLLVTGNLMPADDSNWEPRY